MTDIEWPAPAPADGAAPLPDLNRVDRVREVLRLEGLAAAATERAAAHRALLDQDARAELATHGVAPTWRMPDIGAVSLPVSQEAPYIADPSAFAAWCADRHPAEVEQVPTIRPAFQRVLLARAVCDEDRVVDPETGEPIPGLAVRQGGQAKSLSIRPESGVREAYTSYGRQLLDGALGGGR